ncbi:MAG: hypothetical protein IJ830_04040 [Alphaproteobacteria bacterium]|nr:hypothetical protein [Alphaproteobacteria bacterium]
MTIYDYNVPKTDGGELALSEFKAKNDPDWDKKPDIKWNFTKFLLNRQRISVVRK